MALPIPINQTPMTFAQLMAALGVTGGTGATASQPIYGRGQVVYNTADYPIPDTQIIQKSYQVYDYELFELTVGGVEGLADSTGTALADGSTVAKGAWYYTLQATDGSGLLVRKVPEIQVVNLPGVKFYLTGTTTPPGPIGAWVDPT